MNIRIGMVIVGGGGVFCPLVKIRLPLKARGRGPEFGVNADDLMDPPVNSDWSKN